MNFEGFITCNELAALGYPHGFGTRDSIRYPLPELTLVRQVHGTNMVRVPLETGDVRADALWTSQPGRAIAVYTADCVPILLAHRSGRLAAAIHAGWRGSVAEIAQRSVASLCQQGDVSPADLVAAIGPHIGPCCYEVDAPVIDAVSDLDALAPSPRAGRAMLDLCALNLRQLVSAGVPEASILRVEECTRCNPNFLSYRRDGAGGRMLHYIRVPN